MMSPSRSMPPALNTTRTSEPGMDCGWKPLEEIIQDRPAQPALREHARAGEVFLSSDAHSDRPRPRVLRLEGALAEQEVDDAALVGLEPVQLDGRNRADVQSVDVDRVDQGTLEL